MSATPTARNRIETACAMCSRPMVLEVGIDLDDPELEDMARDLVSMARRVKCNQCNQCHRPPPTVAPSRGAWMARSVPREDNDED